MSWDRIEGMQRDRVYQANYTMEMQKMQNSTTASRGRLQLADNTMETQAIQDCIMQLMSPDERLYAEELEQQLRDSMPDNEDNELAAADDDDAEDDELAAADDNDNDEIEDDDDDLPLLPTRRRC